MERTLTIEVRKEMARNRIRALGTAIRVFGGHVALCKMLGIQLPKRKLVAKKRAKRYVAGMASQMIEELVFAKDPCVHSSEWLVLEMREK
jgi:hypothetical protein